jgi:tetratricopeptide (TPR) repeat protein
MDLLIALLLLAGLIFWVVTDMMKRNQSKLQISIERANLYFWQDEYDKAIAAYTEALRLDPENAYALCWRGAAYCRSREWEKAIADLTKSIQKNDSRRGSPPGSGVADGINR